MTLSPATPRDFSPLRLTERRQEALFRLLMALAVLLGFGLRLRSYFYNRSLWLDEAMLALNILDRSFGELLQPLDYHQGAPVGFLWASKLAVSLLGPGEPALRLVPLLSGLLAVVVFALLAARLLPRGWALAAVFLVSVSPSLIYYSAEVKQYAGDALLALALLGLALRHAERPFRPWLAAVWAAAGALAIWFSHPAVFVLAGTGLAGMVQALRARDRAKSTGMLAVGAVWLVSFAALYAVSLRGLGSSAVLQAFWQAFFAPFPPRSWQDMLWYYNTPLTLFANPAEIQFKGLGLICAAAGGAALSRQNRVIFFSILLTFGFVLLASMFKKYPLGDRLMLFSVPILLLLVVKGIEYLTAHLPGGRVALSALLLLLIAFAPTATTFERAKAPIRIETRAVMEDLRAHWQPGDTLWVYFFARYPFQYYTRVDPAFGPLAAGAVFGEAYSIPGDIVAEMEGLKGRGRVWVLFSYARGEDEAAGVSALEQLGARIEAYSAPGAAVYLYDLKRGP